MHDGSWFIRWNIDWFKYKKRLTLILTNNEKISWKMWYKIVWKYVKYIDVNIIINICTNNTNELCPICESCGNYRIIIFVIIELICLLFKFIG